MAAAAAILAGAGSAQGQPAEGAVSTFPSEFFKAAQPRSAYDMLLRLPGFSFDPGDSDVRGLAGATGNVLIDGGRPTTKADLEDVLRRIPAASVERIELIRAGAAGVDLQGRAVVANVVRKREVALRAEAEAALGRFAQGRLAPRLSGEFSRRSPDRLLEGSASLGRDIEDDKGDGPKLRLIPDGAVLEASAYSEREWQDFVEATLGYETPLAGGALRLDATARREDGRVGIREREIRPGGEEEVVTERERLFEGEVGGRLSRELAGWSAELVGLHRWSFSRQREEERESDEATIAWQAFDAGETVIRAMARREVGGVAIDAGAEGAFNVLDSRSSLVEDDEAIDLPFDNVRVEERRGEAFATVSWSPRESLTLESAIRIEHSRLVQSGDSALEKPLTYWKPRALASWRPTARDEVRLEVERRVGQLDLEDFVSSTSLETNTVTAGNPDLEPERAWRAAASWEHRFGGAGGVTVAIRHDWIEEAVDRVLVVGPGFAFDAVGNIGGGRRIEAQVTASLPLDAIGWTGALFRADAIWRDSRVTDPFTGQQRRLSGEPDIEGELHFSQDLSGPRLRWGVDAVLAATELQYRFDEVREEAEEGRLAVFVEHRPAPAWRVRLEAENLTRGRVLRRRELFSDGRAAGTLTALETREMDAGPFVSVSIRRTLGAR